MNTSRAATPASVSIPPLLHRLRVLIARHVRFGVASVPTSVHLTLLRHLLARPSPALPYALLLTSLFFRREVRRDPLRAEVWHRRADTAEWLATRIVRCAVAQGTGWRAVVESLTWDFSPRQRGQKRSRVAPRSAAPTAANHAVVGMPVRGQGVTAGSPSAARIRALSAASNNSSYATPTVAALTAVTDIARPQSTASTIRDVYSASEASDRLQHRTSMSQLVSETSETEDALLRDTDAAGARAMLAASATPRPASIVSDAATAATSMHHRRFLPGEVSSEHQTDDVSGYSEPASDLDDDASVVNDTPGTSADANDDDRMNALEIAVLARARYFCADPVVSAVVDACWDGRVSFYAAAIDGDPPRDEQAGTSTAVVRIHGGGRAMGEEPTSLWHELWRVSRLRAPRILHILYLIQYLGFLLVFTSILLNRSLALEPGQGRIWDEAVLIVWTIAYIADTISRVYRSGWRFYVQHIVSPLDLAAQGLLLVYAVIRMRTLIRPALPSRLVWQTFGRHHKDTRPPAEELEEWRALTRAAFDVLALAAFPLYARLGTLMDKWRWSGRPQVVLRRVLRHIAWPVIGFWPLAVVGTALALRGLELGASGPDNRVDGMASITAGPWDDIPDQPFVRIFYILGRTALGAISLGFTVAPTFHPVLGPVLMLTFVGLLVLVPMALCLAMILHVFRETAIVDAQANARYRYEFMLQVLEQTRAEPLHPFPPPLNLLYPFVMLVERIFGYEVSARLCRAIQRIQFFLVLVVSLVVERLEARRRRRAVLGPSGFGSSIGSCMGATVFGMGLARPEDLLATLTSEVEAASATAVAGVADEKRRLEREVKELREAVLRLERILTRTNVSASVPGPTASSTIRRIWRSMKRNAGFTVET